MVRAAHRSVEHGSAPLTTSMFSTVRGRRATLDAGPVGRRAGLLRRSPSTAPEAASSPDHAGAARAVRTRADRVDGRSLDERVAGRGRVGSMMSSCVIVVVSSGTSSTSRSCASRSRDARRQRRAEARRQLEPFVGIRNRHGARVIREALALNRDPVDPDRQLFEPEPASDRTARSARRRSRDSAATRGRLRGVARRVRRVP